MLGGWARCQLEGAALWWLVVEGAARKNGIDAVIPGKQSMRGTNVDWIFMQRRTCLSRRRCYVLVRRRIFCWPQVDALAGSMSRPMQSVSMGSSEGFDMADRAMHLASKQGYVVECIKA